MKQILLVFVTATALILSSCAQLQDNLGKFWNDPKTQAAISEAESIALQFALSFLHTQMGAAKVGGTHLKVTSPAVHDAMVKAHDAIKAKHPSMNEDVINDIVIAAFAKTL